MQDNHKISMLTTLVRGGWRPGEARTKAYATALTKRLTVGAYRVGAYSMLFRDFNAHTASVRGGWMEAG